MSEVPSETHDRYQLKLLSKVSETCIMTAPEVPSHLERMPAGCLVPKQCKNNHHIFLKSLHSVCDQKADI